MLQQFQPRDGARVLVVGDVILDRYVYGVSERISPEAPVPVVKISATEERPGGAANVALNVKSLGVGVQLLSITGIDAAAATLEQQLASAGIQCQFVTQTGLPTIIKVRVISQHQQLLRMDYESEFAPSAELLSRYAQLLPGAACVVMSDYAKGSLGAVQNLISQAAAAGVAVLVDPKGIDFKRYRGATLLTPNQREFEAVAGKCRDDGELESRGRTMCRELDLKALLITRGEHGMTLIEAGAGAALHLHARTHEVFDITGAGDTVIGVTAAGLASGYELAHAVEFANAAAGIVVEKLGTAAISLAELNRELIPVTPAARRMLEPDRVAGIVQAAREQGERIVMTNGCFDLLHPGHVEYLEQARQLGDRLLVAVNSDASATRLKGADRPINPLASRMRLLAALACVDWVTSFDEDTPAELVARVRPDVLVKGGDYCIDQVVGAATVQGYGGRVEVLPFLAGHSTSTMVATIVAGTRK